MRAVELLRRRLRGLRGQGDESGFILIYVLMVTVVVTALVATTLVVTGNSVVPSVRSAYTQAADAAAQGGLQAFVAYADKNCSSATSSVAACTLPSNYSGTVSIPIPGGGSTYSASYSWLAVKDPSNRYFRVKSTGTVTQGGVSATKVVVGDVVGGASLNLLDYGVVTGFESESSDSVLSDWPARTIALDAAAVDAADVPVKGGAIRWSGASPGTAAGKVAVCNSTFDQPGGRSSTTPKNAPTPYVDWTESGLAGNNYTHYAPCQTSWGTQTQLLAPDNPANGLGGYYSNDALLLSNSYPGGTGPLFNQPVTTNWRYTSADAGICGTAPGQNYRSFNLLCAGYPVEVGGSPSPSSTYPTVQWVQGPQLPTSSPKLGANTCEYTGPTRVLLNGTTATVTSPQTTTAWITANASTRPAQCYPGAGAQGMFQQSVSLASPTAITAIAVDNDGSVPNTTPAVAHGSSGWPTTGQRRGDPVTTSNSVFYASYPAASAIDPNTATAPDTCSSTATYTGSAASSTCQWSDASSSTAGSGWVADGPGWTKFGTACSTDARDEATFACDYGNGTYTATAYATLRAAVKASLASASVAVAASSYTVGSTTTTCTAGTVTPTTATGAQLACLLQDAIHTANSGQRQDGTGTPAAGDRRYIVSAGTTQTTGPTATTAGTVPSSTAATDPLFTTTTGTASTESVTAKASTLSVSRQTYGCYVPANASITGTLAQILALLGLSPVPGQYDATGGYCGPECATIALVRTCAQGPGTNTWGDAGISTSSVDKSTPQFAVNVTQKTYTNFVQGASTLTSFPSMQDVTQYQIGNSGTFGTSGPGDLYVEGSASSTLALVAAGDTVVTGTLGPANPSTAALLVVGRNNVRVYHPVSCRITDATMIAATDPGFCPDDITGLYTSVPTNGYRPDQQYVNLRGDLANLTITGAIFALGNADAHITCPQPPGGGGVCGGEFSVDNYARGAGLGHLTNIGTLAMAHHSPVGQEWEVADTTGQTSRPYSGYQLAQKYLNVKALVAASPDVNGVLTTTSVTSSMWHILSISAGSGS